MQVLVYKRTHVGDPNTLGCFGCNDCMGRVRDSDYDAVIGVGGLGREARQHGIDGKLTWTGIGVHKTPCQFRRGPIVTFDHFLHFGMDGPPFVEIAPNLAERMYGQNIRYLINGFRQAELLEIEAILELARRAPPSRRRSAGTRRKCNQSERTTC